MPSFRLSPLDYNARFAKPPANNRDLHRPLRAGDDLDDAFAWKEERTLSQVLTLQYDKVMFILEPSEQAKAAIGKRVTVVDYPDGRLSSSRSVPAASHWRIGPSTGLPLPHRAQARLQIMTAFFASAKHPVWRLLSRPYCCRGADKFPEWPPSG